MSDSFFTSRNDYDRQALTWTARDCEQIIEADVRRMVQLQGPFETAKRIQRLSDICAGVYVLPIEHWQKLEAPKTPAPTAPPASIRTRFFNFIGGPTGNYLLGLVTGYLIGSS